jgi:signal recognition particle GTPase
MNPDTLNKLTDPELSQVIAAAQELLQTRAEKRKSDAMEQIRQIAATAQIAVSFDAGRKAKGIKAVLRAGVSSLKETKANVSMAQTVGRARVPVTVFF